MNSARGSISAIPASRPLRLSKQTIGRVIIAAIGIAALCAPWLTSFDPNAVDLAVDEILAPPGAAHPFGTDAAGRDLWARALHGARVSISVGLLSMLAAVALGTIVGLGAGYLGGWIDGLLMRVVDIAVALPLLLLILIAQSYLEPSLPQLIILIAATSWMTVARIVRAETKEIAAQDFIAAATTLGASRLRIMRNHVLPNLKSTLGVAASLAVARAILAEAALSYLGLGVPPPDASWGTMLQDGLSHLQDAPWLVFFPGFLISLTVFGFHSVAETQ